MADEINRASPRTQSALLQAMQERHVSVAGQLPPARRRSTCSPRRTRWSRKAPTRCPKPSSTASCCRSMSTIPTRRRAADADRDHRRRVSSRRAGADAGRADGGAGAGAAHPGRRERGRCDPEAGARRPARPERPEVVRSFVAWGPGPRASQALMLACRARALIDGRLRRRSTTSSRSPTRCCAIAWRSTSRRAPKASGSTSDRPDGARFA